MDPGRTCSCIGPVEGVISSHREAIEAIKGRRSIVQENIISSDSLSIQQ